MILRGIDLSQFCSKDDYPGKTFDQSSPYFTDRYVYCSNGHILLMIEREVCPELTSGEHKDRAFPLKSIATMRESTRESFWSGATPAEIEELLNVELHGISASNFERFREADSERIVGCSYCDDGCDECDGKGMTAFSNTEQYLREYHRSVDFHDIHIALTYLARIYLVMKEFSGQWRWQQAGENGKLSPVHFQGPGVYIMVMPKRKEGYSY